MKRMAFLLFSALFCLSFHGISQKASVGVNGGLVITNQYGKMGGVKYDFTSKTGYTVGLFVDAPIGKSAIHFMPSVNYVQKGAVVVEDDITDVKITRALRYAEFEFNFIAKTNGSGGISIFGGAGPSFAFNLPSQLVTKSGGSKTENNITFGKESPADLNGIDYGFNLVAGISFKNKVLVTGNYIHGIRNLSIVDDDDNRLWNSCFAIRVGFLFGNK